MDDDECDICGFPHETRQCDHTLCGICYQLVDNCDHDDPPEITVEEWLDLGSPQPID